jgi:hypothetical protein
MGEQRTSGNVTRRAVRRVLKEGAITGDKRPSTNISA